MKERAEERTEPDWPRPWVRVHEALSVEMPAFDDRPLGAQVERHARERPDATALIVGEHTISYASLDLMASRLAASLAARGIGRGDVVGVHLPNLPQYAAAVVAVSKIGAIASGVSPLLAPPELAHQLTDSNAKALLTLDKFAPVLMAMKAPPAPLRLVVFTAAGDAISPSRPEMARIGDAETTSWTSLLDGQDELASQVATDPHDTAVIQYTGGTTGRPKGAELSIRTLMNNPRFYNAAAPYEEGAEVVASAFPMFHIAGLSVFISAAATGGAFVMVPDPRDTNAFCRMLLAHPPTRMSNVPALYELLLDDPSFAEVDFSRLRLAASGAAPLSRSTISRLTAVLGEGKLADAFGMTETGPCYTFHPPSVRREGTIGLPMPGAEVRIVDTQTGAPLPLGEAGEIACAGPQVMKGYLNLPEESARAIREHGGRRWMHSGDVGSMDQDGYITLHDRAKDMLIVGGFKVFSVEVEDHLRSLDTVASCAVVGSPDAARPGNDIVHLFVQPTEAGKARGDVLPSELTEHIRETMAAYKVPRHVHLVEAIPLTPVGKIDKKALRGSLAG